MSQLSHLYMTTGKTIALPIQTFVGKVVFYNRLSRFVRAFLPRRKPLLNSWLQSLSTEILEPKKIKFATGLTFSPLICHEVMGQDAMIFVFGMLHFKFSSVSQSCPTLCNPMDYSTPGFPVHHQFLELAQTHVIIESVMPSNHLILCHPLLLLTSIFPSIWVFANESVLCIRWSNYWNFSPSISPSNEHSGPISFRMDWLDLLAVQGTLKSLLQHHSSKASILQGSAFFIVQLSHPYLTTGKQYL